MAAGLTQKQKYHRTVSVLRRLARDYNGTYKDWGASGTFQNKEWEAFIHWGNMSNGESVGQIQFYITDDQAGTRKVFVPTTKRFTEATHNGQD